MKDKIEEIDFGGISYRKPQVILLQETGIGTSELAARTCYDSYSKSENEIIKGLTPEHIISLESDILHELNNINNSELLHQLAWVHHHHSILEHAVLTFFIHGTSRGVLQEHARHRIQSISVRSTRYTMSTVLNAFCCSVVPTAPRLQSVSKTPLSIFKELLLKDANKLFVVTQPKYIDIEIDSIFQKLMFQYGNIGEKFFDLALSKESKEILVSQPSGTSVDELYTLLNNAKNKRNAGDNFKHIVSDNWSTDMVVSFNIRSLKNYLTLRTSGAAFFQMQWLANAIKNKTPSKYLELIHKSNKTNKP